MALNYTQLTQALQDYIETDEDTFVDQIPIIVQQAEDRILKEVQHPVFRKNVTGSTTGNDQYLSIPADFLAPYSLAVIDSGYQFLIFKDVHFIRAAYPLVADTGVPKYYGIFDDEFFILAPTPATGYNAELHYFYRPESIVTAGTSWLGTNAEACLLYGCLVESDNFVKGDPDMMQRYRTDYTEALGKLKLLAEGYNRTDSYRAG